VSIRRVQTERILEEISHSLYASGVKPTVTDIFQQVARYLSRYPAGAPIPLPTGIADYRRISDVRQFNRALLHTAENVSVLYEVMLEHVDEVLLLTDALQAHLERLKRRRKRVEAQIDDYLSSLYNTDGYFYSSSDTFSDIDMTDISLTSAYVDTPSGSVAIPSVSSLTRHVPPNIIAASSITAAGASAALPIREITPFNGALNDAIDNTFWSMEVEVDSPQTVSVIARVVFGDVVQLSRVEFTPYGIKPMRCLVGLTAPGVTGQTVPFGNKVAFGTERMIFTDTSTPTLGAQFSIAKDQYDYTIATTNGTKYRYVFGAKSISFFDDVYDNTATFVSSMLSLPSDLSSDMVIDAVSVVVDHEIPLGTDMKYFVAADDGSIEQPTLDSFDWRAIAPLASGSQGSIIRFDGANVTSRMIRSNPGSGDLLLNPLDKTVSDITLQNPTPAFVPGVDIYRLCDFSEQVLPNSLRMDEGINTVRISYTPKMDPDAVASTNYWGTALQKDTTRITYGRIDVGNDFFYGGDIGESDVSCFVETYIDCANAVPTFLAECAKADQNSQLWALRAYLNGREIGYMPSGNNKMMLPWSFQQGLNHVALLVNIPSGTYAGTIDLMGALNLYDYGTVKLNSWSYVDFFDLQYNTAATPTTFSIYQNQLVTRRKPTDNYRFFYAVDSGRGPTGVRFRADFLREMNSPSVSPRLNSYRLRFAYGEES
jgi:hypothetical protein